MEGPGCDLRKDLNEVTAELCWVTACEQHLLCLALQLSGMPEGPSWSLEGERGRAPVETPGHGETTDPGSLHQGGPLVLSCPQLSTSSLASPVCGGALLPNAGPCSFLYLPAPSSPLPLPGVLGLLWWLAAPPISVTSCLSSLELLWRPGGASGPARTLQVYQQIL